MTFLKALFLDQIRDKLTAVFPGENNPSRTGDVHVSVSSVTINGKEVGGSGGDATQARGEMVEQKRPLDSFKGLVANVPATITVKRGATPSATVLAQSDIQDNITTALRGGNLVISSKGSFSTRKGIFIAVVTDQPLGFADISGAVNAELGELAGDVSIQVSGASTAHGHGSMKEVSIELAGASTLTLKGAAERVVLEQSGAGNANLGELKATRARLDISGASHAEVCANEVLAADISGAASLRVLGNPAQRSVDKSGVASVSFR